MKKILGLLLLLLPGLLSAQETFIFGATTNVPGGTLVFQNASTYVASNLFVLGGSVLHFLGVLFCVVLR